MKTINRYVAVLHPKKDYLKWIQTLPHGDLKVTMEDVQDDKTSYLTPKYDTIAQAEEFIYKNAKAIMEFELSGWDTTGEYWPERLDRRLLKKFFDVEISSMVVDLMRSEVEREEL